MIFTDQLNRAVNIPNIPQRIISLVPSQTELLYDLGLGDRVVGITKFCIHPKTWFKTKKKVGGTKNFKIEVIKELQPDLIIANKEENIKEGIEELSRLFPVWISDVETLGEALDMIKALGLVLDRKAAARELISNIEREKAAFILPKSKKRCTYLIWREPYMTVGGDTFINTMLDCAGFDNTYKNLERYPSITLDEMRENESEYILLSSEPYPFKEKHLLEIKNATGKKVLLVDGELFSWYGSRLLKAWDYFSTFAE